MNNITQNPYNNNLIYVYKNGKFLEESDIPLVDISDEGADNYEKFNNMDLTLKEHPTELLKYGGMLQIKHLDSDTGKITFRRLKGVEVLILLELYDNFKYYTTLNLGVSPTSEMLLARAADISVDYVSKIIKPLLEDKFYCPLCQSEYIILEAKRDVVYQGYDDKFQEGRRGYYYVIKGVSQFLGHLNSHWKEDKETFYLKMNELEKHQIKKVSEKSLKNLKSYIEPEF